MNQAFEYDLSKYLFATPFQNGEYIEKSYDEMRSHFDLKTLFDDLFVEKKRYSYTDENGNGKKTLVHPALLCCKLNQVKYVSLLFPPFESKTATISPYISQLCTKGIRKQHPTYQNQIAKQLNNNPDQLIQEMEIRSKNFLVEYCGSYNEEILNKYLSNCIDEIINHYVELTKYANTNLLDACEQASTENKVDNSNEREEIDATNNKKALEENIKNELKSHLSVYRHNSEKLLSKVLLIAALAWKDMSLKNMRSIILVQKSISNLSECDELYLNYLNCKTNSNANKGFIILDAYNKISNSSMFEKEILIEYAQNLIDTDKQENLLQAFSLIKNVTTKFKNCGLGFFLLSKCYREGIGCDKSEKMSLEALNIAIELQDVESILYLANERQKANNIEEAIKLYQDALTLITDKTSFAYAKTNYNLGILYERILIGDASNCCTPKTYFLESAKAGYEPAIKKIKLSQKVERTIWEDNLVVSNSNKKHFLCFVNNTDKSGMTFLSCLEKNNWNIYTSTDNDQSIPCCKLNFFISEMLNNIKNRTQNYEKILISFCSEDEEQNITEVLYCLDHLYNIVVRLDNEGQVGTKSKIMDIVSVVVVAKWDSIAPLLDASLSNMGDICFDVRICDTNLLAARQLLFTAPLFIPCIKEQVSNPKVVAIGNSDFIYNFVRESTACTYMANRKVYVSVLGENSSDLQNKFKQNCPGFFNNSHIQNKITPDFYQVDLSSPTLPKILSGIAEPQYTEVEKNVANALTNANYYVIDIGSDIENIRFGRQLRGWLLKNDKHFTRLPFIAIHCNDSRNANLVQNLTVGNQNSDERWFNNYNLYCCGMLTEVYDDMISDGIISMLSENIHLSYYGASDSENGLKDYRTCSYNRDSSSATATALIYRLFDNGCCFSDYRKYYHATIEDLKVLAERYELSDQNIDILAAAEQSRWNGFMLSRGWETASRVQVVTYMSQQSNFSHKQELSLLHPYISEWEDLSDGTGSNFSLLKEQLPEANLKSPILSTRKSIRSTKSFFDINKSKKRELEKSNER